MMKKPVMLIIAVLMLLFTQAAHAGWTRLADNVYSYVGEKDPSPAHSFAANAGIIIGKDGVLVVDTLISAREGERFLADIRKVTNKPIRYVVNTHTHLDHAFGNCVFARLGATIISHAADREEFLKTGQEVLKNSASFGLKPEDMAGTTIVPPTIAFSGRLWLDLGDETVELVHVAPSHTPGSIAVLLPAKKVLFAGDILFTDFHPYLADGDLPGWVKTLDALQAMDIERIVPGHGPLSSKKDLEAMKAYLLLFDKRARELAAKGLDVGAIAAALAKELPQRSMAEWMIEYNVKSKYAVKK